MNWLNKYFYRILLKQKIKTFLSTLEFSLSQRDGVDNLFDSWISLIPTLIKSKHDFLWICTVFPINVSIDESLHPIQSLTFICIICEWCNWQCEKYNHYIIYMQTTLLSLLEALKLLRSVVNWVEQLTILPDGVQLIEYK